MPRPPRLNLVGIPQHITQRGNNRQDCFFLTEDRLTYLKLMDRAARRWAWIIARDALPMEHFSMMPRNSPGLMKSGTAIAKGFPWGENPSSPKLRINWRSSWDQERSADRLNQINWIRPLYSSFPDPFIPEGSVTGHRCRR